MTPLACRGLPPGGLLVALLLALPASAAAQALPGTARGAEVRSARLVEPHAWDASRPELERLARDLQGAVASSAYGERIRSQARERLAQVQGRLARGDFRPGDQVVVRIESQAAPLFDTLTVADSLILALPNIRRVRLDGVLRSELEPLLAREVAVVVREAVVEAHTLMRVAVFGEVVRPGFLMVPPQTTIDQLVTLAGGPTPAALFNEARLMRGDTIVGDPRRLRASIVAGQSLAQLDLRDGDQLVLPARPTPWDRASTLGIVSLFLGPVITMVLVQ